MASGMPSRRRQTRATAGAFCSDSANVGHTARARSSNKRTAPSSASRSIDGSSFSLTASGGTGQIVSFGTPSGSRLVARMRSLALVLSRLLPSSAHAASRCSQLSRTTSRCRSASAAESVSQDRPPGVFVHAHRGGQLARDQEWVGQRGKLDHDGTVRMVEYRACRHGQRQPRFADAAHAGKRHQALRTQ